MEIIIVIILIHYNLNYRNFVKFHKESFNLSTLFHTIHNDPKPKNIIQFIYKPHRERISISDKIVAMLLLLQKYKSQYRI